MGSALQLSGMRFGKLIAISCVGKNKHGMRLWKCKCDCGNETVVAGGALKSGHTKSCGCNNLEHAKKLNRKHGDSRTRLYSIHVQMIDRCTKPRKPEYKYYGGRGIKVCDEWFDWETFKKWAMENGYRDDLSIDRIDVNGNYEPSNCRWATRSEQMRNTRKTKYFVFEGIKKPLIEWCEQFGLEYHTVLTRIRRGWSDPYEILFGRRKNNEYSAV